MKPLCAASLLLVWLAAAAGSPAQAGEPNGATEPAGTRLLVTLALPDLPAHPATGVRRKYGAPPDGYRIPRSVRRLVRDLEREYALSSRDSWPIDAIGVYCILFQTTSDTPIDRLQRTLADDPRIDGVQKLQHFKTMTSTYDDPYLHLQHGARALQLEAAHRWADGLGVRVAVIDSGIDVHHPELRGRISLSRDFAEENRGGAEGDRHGTLVAGIIASVAGNGIGIVGIAPRARLLALRACWSTAGAGEATCDSFTIAKALGFALENRPQIINLSLAGPGDALLERLVAEALARGVTVVAASSRDPADRFPAHLPGVLAVAPSMHSETPAQPSLLAAPGHDVLSTTPRGQFDYASGSSLAAAHVSGVAALLLQADPGLKPEAIRDLLVRSSATGEAGSINACEALSQLMRKPPCPVLTATLDAP